MSINPSPKPKFLGEGPLLVSLLTEGLGEVAHMHATFTWTIRSWIVLPIKENILTDDWTCWVGIGPIF